MTRDHGADCVSNDDDGRILLELAGTTATLAPDGSLTIAGREGLEIQAGDTIGIRPAGVLAGEGADAGTLLAAARKARGGASAPGGWRDATTEEAEGWRRGILEAAADAEAMGQNGLAQHFRIKAVMGPGR